MSHISSKGAYVTIFIALMVLTVLTVGFYVIVGQEPLRSSALHTYTAEHAVQYVVVAFFFWGIVDVVFRACGFPLELMAMRQETLPERSGREPVQNARAMYAQLSARPDWFGNSRLGQRLLKALGHLQDKGSADGFNEYRFAGAGFAGQNVQARLELNFYRVDDREAFDAEKAQHGGKRARSSIRT